MPWTKTRASRDRTELDMIIDQDVAEAVTAEAKRTRFWFMVLVGLIAAGLGLLILA